MSSREMTSDEFIQLVKDEICCVTVDSKIDGTRATWKPSTELFSKAPQSVLRDPELGKKVLLLQLEALMKPKF